MNVLPRLLLLLLLLPTTPPAAPAGCVTFSARLALLPLPLPRRGDDARGDGGGSWLQ